MKTQLFTLFLTLTLAAVLGLEMASMARAQEVEVGEDEKLLAFMMGVLSEVQEQ